MPKWADAANAQAASRLQVLANGTAVLLLVAGVVCYIIWKFNGAESIRWWRRQRGGGSKGAGAGGGQTDDPPLLLNVPWALMSFVPAVAAPGGLLLTLVISVSLNYKGVTAVHCGRAAIEFFPSVSACIGDFSPQRWIWRASMTLYIWQRLLSGPMLFQLHKSLAGGGGPLHAFRLAVFTGEQLGLLMLTSVSSTDNLLLHQLFLGTFAACSVLNMLITYVLCGRWLRMASSSTWPVATGGLVCLRRRFGPDVALLSLRWRGISMAVNYIALGGMVYWYLVHRIYCPDFAYSYFAMCEWTFVFSNIFFHYCDLSEMRGLGFAFVYEAAKDES